MKMQLINKIFIGDSKQQWKTDLTNQIDESYFVVASFKEISQNDVIIVALKYVAK